MSRSVESLTRAYLTGFGRTARVSSAHALSATVEDPRYRDIENTAFTNKHPCTRWMDLRATVLDPPVTGPWAPPKK